MNNKSSNNSNNNNIDLEEWERHNKIIAEKKKVARQFSLVGHGEQQQPIITEEEREQSRELVKQISDLGKSIFVHSVVRASQREGDTSDQEEVEEYVEKDDGHYSTNSSSNRSRATSTASSSTRKSRFINIFGFRKKEDKRDSNLSEPRGSNLSTGKSLMNDSFFKARQSQNQDFEFNMDGLSSSPNNNKSTR